MAAKETVLEEFIAEETVVEEAGAEEAIAEELNSKEKESVEIEKLTVEDFFTAFENSSFYDPGYRCAITHYTMVEPVVLSSGHSYDRLGAIQLIVSTLGPDGAPKPDVPLVCPLGRGRLGKILRDEAEDVPEPFTPNDHKDFERLTPEALKAAEDYIIHNHQLRSLIAEAIQKFKDSPEGAKYKNFEVTLTRRLREEKETAQPLPLNPVAENAAVQNDPLNRNTFFTEQCVGTCSMMAPLAAVAPTVCVISGARSLLCPVDISAAQTLMLCCCSIPVCASITCLCIMGCYLGIGIEEWCRGGGEAQANDGAGPVVPLMVENDVMGDESEENEIEMQEMGVSSDNSLVSSGNSPTSLSMSEDDNEGEEHDSVPSVSRLSLSRANRC